MPLADIESIIKPATPGSKFVENDPRGHRRHLTPVAITGGLTMGGGPRPQDGEHGPQYLAAFVIGDQLLWGAAEPLRRMPRILLEALRANGYPGVAAARSRGHGGLSGLFINSQRMSLFVILLDAIACFPPDFRGADVLRR